MSIQKISDTPQKVLNDIAWSQPENNIHAPRVTILGGSAGHFALLSKYYTALTPTIGLNVSLVAPASLQPILKNTDAQVQYIKSHTLGHISLQALDEAVHILANVSTCLIAGDLGKSSETQQFLHALVTHTQVRYVIPSDALQSFAEHDLADVCMQKYVTFVINEQEMQHIIRRCGHPTAYTSTLTIQQKVTLLETFSKEYNATFIINGINFFAIADSGDVRYDTITVSPDILTLEITKWPNWYNKNYTDALTYSYTVTK